MQSLPSAIGNVLWDIVCPSTTVCEAVAIGYDGVYDGFPPAGNILSTTNGGVTWTESTVPSDTGAITKIVCPSTTVCETVGQNSSDAAVILGTTNGGSTWTTQTTLAGSTQGFVGDIACASTTVCEAAGDGYSGGAVLGTTNGGRPGRLKRCLRE